MSSTPIQREPAPDVPKPSDSFRFSIRGLLLVTAGVAAALALVTQLGAFGLAIVATAAGLAAIWSGRKKWEGGGFGVPLGIVCLVVAGFLVLFLAAAESRPAARRSACSNNLKQIALALHNYHDTFGSFPPAYIADENGRPMHSWRVLILPFLESSDLYSKYRFDEPWDGPNNRLLADRMPRTYCCPSEPRTNPPSLMTSYLAVVGPETVWPEGKAVAFSDIQDGTSNTLLVVESHGSGIHWMEPRDLHTGQMAREINPSHGQGICSCHGADSDQGRGMVAQVAFTDGSVRSLENDLTREELEALLTIEEGEKDPLDGP
jgi:hypothetical protein